MVALEWDTMLWLQPPQLSTDLSLSFCTTEWLHEILYHRWEVAWDAVGLQKHSKIQVQWKLQNSQKIRGNSNNDICSMHPAPSIQLCLVLMSLTPVLLASWDIFVLYEQSELPKDLMWSVVTTDFFSFVTWFHQVEGQALFCLLACSVSQLSLTDAYVLQCLRFDK